MKQDTLNKNLFILEIHMLMLNGSIFLQSMVYKIGVLPPMTFLVKRIPVKIFEKQTPKLCCNNAYVSLTHSQQFNYDMHFYQ